MKKLTLRTKRRIIMAMGLPLGVFLLQHSPDAVWIVPLFLLYITVPSFWLRCPHCGKSPIRVNSRFCPYCGKEIGEDT